MAIGTGQVSLEDIRIEVGTARPISLGELSSKTWKGGEANYASFKETRSFGSDSTYATAVAAQGTGLAGLNNDPYGVSEWKGYTHAAASTIGSATDWVFESENYAMEIEDDENAGPNTMSTGSGCELWCTKSGSTVTIYISGVHSGSQVFQPDRSVSSNDISANALLSDLREPTHTVNGATTSSTSVVMDAVTDIVVDSVVTGTGLEGSSYWRTVDAINGLTLTPKFFSSSLSLIAGGTSVLP